jgi:hypothetical protein
MIQNVGWSYDIRKMKQVIVVIIDLFIGEADIGLDAYFVQAFRGLCDLFRIASRNFIQGGSCNEKNLHAVF